MFIILFLLLYWLCCICVIMCLFMGFSFFLVWVRLVLICLFLIRFVYVCCVVSCVLFSWFILFWWKGVFEREWVSIVFFFFELVLVFLIFIFLLLFEDILLWFFIRFLVMYSWVSDFLLFYSWKNYIFFVVGLGV